MISYDLIACIIYAHSKGLTFRIIEELFGIPRSSACRWYNKYSPHTGNKTNVNEIIKALATKEINDESIKNPNVKILDYIKKSLSIQPFQTQGLLKEKVQMKFGLHLQLKVISKYIKLIGFSKKRITKRFNNGNIKELKLKRNQFRKEIKKINKAKIICIDESGFNRNTHSHYGYSKSSTRLIASYSIKYQKNHSLLIAIRNHLMVSDGNQ